MLIDDFTNSSLVSSLGTSWRAVSDRVMGGVSEAAIVRVAEGDGHCLRLSGDVRLENNGGFIQAALDLSADGGPLDASAFTGIRLEASGNGETYSVHLRTTDLDRPWQSYRVHFEAGPQRQMYEFPFSAFAPYRTDVAFDARKLKRIGLVAVGRAFAADLQVCRIAFY